MTSRLPNSTSKLNRIAGVLPMIRRALSAITSELLITTLITSEYLDYPGLQENYIGLPDNCLGIS